jgi:hypothetical protein
MSDERTSDVHERLEGARQRAATAPEGSRERHDAELDVRRAQALLADVSAGSQADATQAAADAMDLPVEGSRENG